MHLAATKALFSRMQAAHHVTAPAAQCPAAPWGWGWGLRAWLCLHPMLQPHCPQQLLSTRTLHTQDTAHSGHCTLTALAQLLSCTPKGHSDRPHAKHAHPLCAAGRLNTAHKRRGLAPALPHQVPHSPMHEHIGDIICHQHRAAQQLSCNHKHSSSICLKLKASAPCRAVVSGHRAMGHPAGSASAPTTASTYLHSAPVAMQEH